MKEILLVIGGCRSGKSEYAIKAAGKIDADPKIMVATCVPRDDEMMRRVVNHQKRRGPDWTTLEVPALLPETISERAEPGALIVVDCLTLWVSNLLLESEDPDALSGHAARLTDALAAARCPVVLVSNEVGLGIVPNNRLARLFRDVAGEVNARVAAAADRVVWMVAGIPVRVK